MKWDHPIIPQSHKGLWTRCPRDKSLCDVGTLPYSRLPTLYTPMPLDRTNRYVTPEGLGRTLSRNSNISYPRARGSTRFGPRPYPSLRDIATRIDGRGDSWFDHTGDDLHFRDFGFQARIQVARRLSQRADRGGGRDGVLERLLVEGTFDREEASVVNVAEEYAMHHASAVGLRLLIRVEELERRVSCDLGLGVLLWSSNDFFLSST
jgi:hypothetical protein